MSRTVGNRAMRALAHPLTLTCILVLLLNDQVLRVHWPSWFTGKLGDIAWLAFAPLVVGLPTALVLPRLWPSPTGRDINRLTIGTALALVGTVFTVVKGLPAATAAFSATFATVFGWTPLIVCDPTDLLTLPALGLAYWIWQSSAQSAEQPVRTQRHRGLVVLALAALVTLGNSGPPDEGIVCLEAEGRRLLAGPLHDYAFTHTFASGDGGLTWIGMEEQSESADDLICDGGAGAWPVTLPDGSRLRYVPGKAIERSDDDGATWAAELRLTGEEARLAYNQNARFYYGATLGPNDILIDPTTGNVIIAMGLEGVLVRDASGAWEWVTVGPYSYEPIEGVAQLFSLLQGELALAVAAGAVAVALIGWRTWGWPLRVLSVVAAIGTAGVQLLLQPALASGYARSAAGLGSLATLAITVILAIIAAVVQLRRGGASRLWRIAGAFLVPCVLTLLPFVLWGLGLLPVYVTAMWIAVIVSVVAWIGSALASGSSPELPTN